MLVHRLLTEGVQEAFEINEDHRSETETDRPWREHSSGQEASDFGPIVSREGDVLEVASFLVVARNAEALTPAGSAVGIVGVVDIHFQTALRVLE